MKIIFVYNANSSLFSQVTDYAHKLLSPKTYQCNLCKLTYGNLGMKQDWKNFIKKLSVKSEFSHKDTFIQKYPQFGKILFPAIFREEKGKVMLLITAQEINSQYALKSFKNFIMQKMGE